MNHSTILSAKAKFAEEFGVTPNALLVAPNAELELNRLGIKIGKEFFGMLVIPADLSDDDFTPALVRRV